MKRSLLWQLPLLAMLFGCVGPWASKKSITQLESEFVDAADAVGAQTKLEIKNVINIAKSQYAKEGVVHWPVLDWIIDDEKANFGPNIRSKYREWKAAFQREYPNSVAGSSKSVK